MYRSLFCFIENIEKLYTVFRFWSWECVPQGFNHARYSLYATDSARGFGHLLLQCCAALGRRLWRIGGLQLHIPGRRCDGWNVWPNCYAKSSFTQSPSFQSIFFQVVKVDGWFLIKIPSCRFCTCDHYHCFVYVFLLTFYVFSLVVGVKGLLIYIGSYKLAWTRTYDAWSSQGEQHIGKWTIDLDQIHCETLEPESSSETEMRYAPAGYKFAIPLKDILILGWKWTFSIFKSQLGWGCFGEEDVND